MTVNRENAELRKYEDDLYVSGMGLIVMGLWGVVKATLGIFWGAESTVSFEADSALSKAVLIIIMVIIVAVMSALILYYHFYIGLNAIRASKGQPYKKGYMAGTCIMLLLNLISLFYYKDKFTDMKNIDTTIASLLVDMTTAYVCLSVIITTYKVRKYRKENPRE